MRMPRLMTPGFSPSRQSQSLTVAQAHYVGRVLRLKPGAHLLLTDGNGGEYLAEILHIGRGTAQVRTLSNHQAPAESTLSIELALAICKGERMDFAIQKSVELGVSSISPLLTEHTVVQLDPKRTAGRMQHWQKIIISACEQSGRSHLPQLNPPVSISTWVTTRADVPAVIFHPRADQSLTELSPIQEAALQLLIGPEGGFSDQEVALAQQADIKTAKLGPRTLRAETAATAAVCAAQILWGDMN